MAPLVRVVCGECLQSLEFDSGEGAQLPGVACPYCGAAVSLSRGIGSDAPTGEGFIATPPPSHFFEAKTPRIESRDQAPAGLVGRFLIREPLGEGGYGQVFRAYDPHLEREVALKVLKPNRLGEKALERFFREARAAARLDHPNIVGLHDAGRDDGRCWIAYQLVSGRTLSLIRDTERPSIDASVRIVRDLALALDHAHGRGVFHRDLKPANVLVDDAGRPRLTDFGLARREDVDSDLTREGTVLGTPQYMSPEAAAGRAHQADARSDVYSLGVILYELICGRRPADVPSGAPLWQSTRIATPPTPRSVDRAIPPSLDRICMKALAFDPKDRHPDARTLADALTHFLQTRPAPKPGPGDRPRPISARVPRGRLTIGLAVAASILCLSLGISFRLQGGPAGEVGSLWSGDTGTLGSTMPDRVLAPAVFAGLDGASKAADDPAPAVRGHGPGPVGPTASPSDRPDDAATAGPIGAPMPSGRDDRHLVYNSRSKVYHRASCRAAKEIKEGYRFDVPDEQSIKTLGLISCSKCLNATAKP